MTKYYLKYDSLRGKFFVDVYESIKRTEKQLKEYAEAVEHLAESESELVFDTKDFDLVESYEYEGDIFSLREIVGVDDASKVINEITFKHNNSFRIPKNVDVYMDGNYVKLKLRGKVEKFVSVNVSTLEDVLKYFHPTIDGKDEIKQEEILDNIRKLLK